MVTLQVTRDTRVTLVTRCVTMAQECEKPSGDEMLSVSMSRRGMG